MQPFVINRHGRLVFPSNFMPDLDFSVIETEEQLDQVIRRDFETKAPSGTEIGERIENGAYKDRVAADARCRAEPVLGQQVRHDDVREGADPLARRAAQPRRRLPAGGAALAGQGEQGRRGRARRTPRCRPAGDAETEDRIWEVLFDVVRHRKHHASALEAIRPTVAQALRDPTQLTFQLGTYDPDYPVFSYADIVDCQEDVAELEALHRWAMVLHNQYPWDRADVRLTALGDLQRRRRRRRCSSRRTRRSPGSCTRSPRARRGPSTGHPGGVLRAGGGHQAADPAVPGGRCPQAVQGAAQDRGAGRGPRRDPLLQRRSHPQHGLLLVADDGGRDQLQDRHRDPDVHRAGAGRDRAWTRRPRRWSGPAGRPEEIGAVIFCSCTNHRSMPSMATWLSGQLGMFQTHMSADITAACAGLPYGLSEAIRLLQEVNRPVLLVCGEKFSDKIGTVRPSRMIFGDGAAAFVIAPAARGRGVRHRPACRPTPAGRSARSTRSSGRTPRSTTTSPCSGRRSRRWPAATWSR